MNAKPYKARTLRGATQRVRAMQESLVRIDRLARKYYDERNALAKLAADGPAFDNPLVVFEAKCVRDRVLRELGLRPDGSWIGPKVANGATCG